MPRIVTIVSPDVPDISLFMGAALARTPDFTMSRTPDSSLMRFIDGEHPEQPALDVPHPFTVVDPREVERVVGVLPPAEWQPIILTRCMLPVGTTYNMWVPIVADVARMVGGLAVERNKVFRPREPWPWSRGEDGKWTADPAWLETMADAYYERTGKQRPDAPEAGPTGPSASAAS